MALQINPQLLRFFVVAILFYIGWTALYELWIHPDRTLELWVVGNISDLGSGALKIMGYELITSEFMNEHYRTIGIDGTHGVYISDSCAGVPLMALFTGFIIAYPGKWKAKLIYIPIGVLTIHLINVLRIVGLMLLAKHAPHLLDFNHHYTFTFVVYAYIFILWVVWVNKFGKSA